MMKGVWEYREKGKNKQKKKIEVSKEKAICLLRVFGLANTVQPQKTRKECCSVTKAPIKRSEEHKCQEIRARQTCPDKRLKRALCGSQSGMFG
ncbi:hypothetical protein CDAR_599911 [Caerostris darwini]|uniref:Uncharacterized protein n=1 Tax=Caerostris darwini TaxID=1538125 RepID=A0AAV4RN28_9ARAC|nr:hypothetical protein CDAR_599911 [Caerostris darwini]